MSNIFFTSDTHYGHRNIVRGVSNWENKDGCRDFDTLEEHNETIITNLNEVVGQDDTLYHLGDWSFGGIQNIWNFRQRINCRNIHLILGNHDHHIRNCKPLPNVRKADFVQSSFFNEEIHGLKMSFLEWDECIDADDIFLSVQDVLELSIDKKTHIFLSHYAHRVWNGSHKGVIHLYGHSHGSIPDYGKSMDVGVDTNNLKPYSLDEILSIMNKRDIEFPDHHDVKTNWR
jgi:calcineurin-like phosphoesterase family protein